MSVDLNSCIGCGSCIIACHVENNVPVVGKDEIRRGRDLHWLRIDRYFSSDMNMEKGIEKGMNAIATYGEMEVPADNPVVVFMPLMCQHCNHAPCETVCPVLATTHSEEGLNQMTYNRCIGTRYCANNCPYKVRRFNWFNYQDYKKFQNVNPAADEMSRLVLNPEVTVRSRRVMEKCSFCVQRLQESKLTAKKEGRKLVDGDAITACAEACPAGCFKFGDWNDTESQVRKKSADDRGYQALEEVGVEPNVWCYGCPRPWDSGRLSKAVRPPCDPKPAGFTIAATDCSVAGILPRSASRLPVPTIRPSSALHHSAVHPQASSFSA